MAESEASRSFAQVRFVFMARAFQCGSAGDTIEPVAHHVAWSNGSRLADQHEESSLKSIFNISFIPQNPPADAQHHRPMQPDQGREGICILLMDEAFQPLAIGGVAGFCLLLKPAQTLHHATQGDGRHELISVLV